MSLQGRPSSNCSSPFYVSPTKKDAAFYTEDLGVSEGVNPVGLGLLLPLLSDDCVTVTATVTFFWTEHNMLVAHPKHGYLINVVFQA